MGPTQEPNRTFWPLTYGTVTRWGGTFQTTSARVMGCVSPVLQPPKGKPLGFRLVRVRSPLLTESRLLSFPGGTEMFQFPPFATCAYGFSAS